MNPEYARRTGDQELIRELCDALESLIERFEKCAVMSGTDKEFARIATASERELLKKVRGE